MKDQEQQNNRGSLEAAMLTYVPEKIKEGNIFEGKADVNRGLVNEQLNELMELKVNSFDDNNIDNLLSSKEGKQKMMKNLEVRPTEFARKIVKQIKGNNMDR